MQLKTILNRCQRYKGFVYGNARFTLIDGKEAIEVEMLNRQNSPVYCSGCYRRAPLYDRTTRRRFEFIPILGFAVVFLYLMRRVHCPHCGVRVELVPWADGKHQLTLTYMEYLAKWAKILSWKEIADHFHISWEKVFHSVEYIVEWGLKHRDLSGIRSIGVDEISRRKGHKYVTLVYQIDQGMRRLLWVGKERTTESLQGFFDTLGEERSRLIEFVCSDMWVPYLNVIKERASQALHVLDRFHIVSMLTKAIDEIRADEHRRMKSEGFDPVLAKSRWLLLKRPENLSESQIIKLEDLLRYNLRTVRAYLLKEEFDVFWQYLSPYWAEKFLDKWMKQVMQSKIEPLKKVVRTLRRHKPLILNWFKAKRAISNGIVEGMNNKAKVISRKAYGFRTFRCQEVALYHALGDLPVPKSTHCFY